ncbi:hypothetical protein A0J61_04085 [Choanephora cucurbitarum]|uniref:Uncharacterized protein n=1 Tax=Choanephora cucurbitarum TaxID=101091 RepID=A0A1C7NFK7_9FUNG|nr:hypothetical protein A0J61_04085 [Choanephora cucurbitarum]
MKQYIRIIYEHYGGHPIQQIILRRRTKKATCNHDDFSNAQGSNWVDVGRHFLRCKLKNSKQYCIHVDEKI